MDASIPYPSLSQQDREALVKQAVQLGTKRYINELRENVDPFVEHTYSLSEAWKINKKALGKDLLKAPANVLWTPFHFALTGIGSGIKKINFNEAGERLTALPAGFATDVEKEVEWRLYTDFLGLPYQSECRGRAYDRNRLMEIILEEECLTPLLAEGFNAVNELALSEDGQATLTENLLQYVDNRKAASELSATLIGAAASFVTTKHVNLGALSLGQTLATSAAYHTAVSGFALGNTLGGIYYSVMPVSASTGAIVLSTGGIAAILGVISAFGGIISDPLQKAFGWHQKKLHKLVDAIESQLVNEQHTNLALADGYAARVMDVLDILIAVSLKR